MHLRVRVLGIALLAGSLLQGAGPSFRSDVFPIFRDNCLACHSAQVKMGEFVIESYEDLMRGGKSGKAIVPGDSDASLLARMIEGRAQPKMPLSGGDLPPQNIAVIKQWIDSGAKGETVEAGERGLPEIKPRGEVASPVGSLAFSPDGKTIALGRYKQVQLLDTASGEVTATLDGHADLVRAVAFSPDGKRLAAAGGAPGEFGEVVLWNLATREPEHTIRAHADCIYAVDISSDGKQVVTASYDKLIFLWDAATGEKVKTLKDHVDAVFAVDFGPRPGQLLSGAADRSVKLWNLAEGKPSLTLSEPLEGVISVAFDPAGKRIAAAGEDKTIRVWRVDNEEQSEATLIKAMTGHEAAILKIVYSPDGKTLVSSSSDGSLKIWDATTLAERKVLAHQPDWPQALAFSPDGGSFAVGRYDGSFSLYDASSFEEIRGLWPASGGEGL